MHRHRLRAFVAGVGETDVPVAIFANGQFLRFINKDTGIITSGLGPGTTTINALATWGDTTGTQLLNTSVLLDNGGNMTQLVTLDGQDAPRITATLASASPVTGHITLWASSSAPWKLDQAATLNVVNEDGADSIYGVGSINGIIPGRWVLGPISATSTDNAIARWDGTTGRLLQNSTVSIDDSGNITGVTTLNGQTPGSFMIGAASSTNNALVTFSGTTGKQANNASTITSTFGQFFGVTDINSTSVPSGLWVRGPVSAANTQVAIWSGTDGRQLTSAGMTIDTSGNVSNVNTLNGVAPNTWVVGPASATTGALATYNGTTGKLIQSATTITASGGVLSSVAGINSLTLTGATVSGLTTLNGTTVPSGLWVQGPGSATDTAIARYSGTTGKIIQNSSATIDGSGNITAGTYNAVNVAAHASRHLPGGADELVPSGFAGDVLTYASPTTFGSRTVSISIMDGATVGTGGISTFVAGRVLNVPKRSAARNFFVGWNVPFSFADTTLTLNFRVISDDNAGRWQGHSPNASGHAAFGSSATFAAAGFPIASFWITAGFVVPSGSGTYAIYLDMFTSSSTCVLESGGTVILTEGQ